MKVNKISYEMSTTLTLLVIFIWTTCESYRVEGINPTCEKVSTPMCLPVTDDIITAIPSPQGRRNRRSVLTERVSKQINWRYNSTTFPTFANDVTPDDVIDSLRKLHPMVATECSKFVRLFLCSVYSPVCTEFGVVPPCKELCEKVMSDCSRTIKEFGIQWPDSVQCDIFPAYGTTGDVINDSLLVGAVTSQNDENTMLIQRSASLAWMEALVADGKICIPPIEEDVITPQLELLKQNIDKRPNHKLNYTITKDNHQFGLRCPAEMRAPEGQPGYSFLGMQNCSPPCPNMYLSDGELSGVRHLIIFMSTLCIIVTFFTLCTFLIDTKRFRYPERPIVFYAFSYFIVSLVFMTGYLLKENAACNGEIRDKHTNDIVQGFTVVKGDHRQSCTIIFMILYYFTVNGTIWWLILTITWLLAAGFKWGTEAIEKYSIYYHAIAWGIPAIQTMVVVTFSKIEGDNISGVCFLGLYDSQALRYLLLTPLCVYLFIGTTILCTGFCCLNRVRIKLRNDEVNKKKLSQFMLRIGVFSVMYIVPQVILFTIYIVEDSYRTRWEATWFLKSCEDYRVPCPALDSNVSVTAGEGDLQPHVMIFCVKYFMTLIVALPPLFWVASKKTLLSWQLFCCRKKRRNQPPIVSSNHNQNNSRGQNLSRRALLGNEISQNSKQHRARNHRPRSLGDGGIGSDDVFVGLESASKLHGSSASVTARAKITEERNSRQNEILQHKVIEDSNAPPLPPPPPPVIQAGPSVRKKTELKKQFPEKRKQRRSASSPSTSSRGKTSSIHKPSSMSSSTSAQHSMHNKRDTHIIQQSALPSYSLSKTLPKDELVNDLRKKLRSISPKTPDVPTTSHSNVASTEPMETPSQEGPPETSIATSAQANYESTVEV
ncbi:frizzled-2-like [Styela clava]